MNGSAFFAEEVGTVTDMVMVLDEELYPEGLTQGYATDTCLDLAVRWGSPNLTAHTTHRAALGVGVDVPEGYVGLVVPRSSTASKGIQVPIVALDPGYTGEVHTWLTAPFPTRYARGEVLVGLMVVPCVAPGGAPRRDGPREDGTLESSDAKGPTL